MVGVFNLISQVGLNWLGLPFVTWDPAEEFPSVK